MGQVLKIDFVLQREMSDGEFYAPLPPRKQEDFSGELIHIVYHIGEEGDGR